MRITELLRNFVVSVYICLLMLLFCFPQKASPLTNLGNKKQTGNSISGYVFGSTRQSIPNVDVELSDDFSRTIARVQTNSSGRYEFNRLSSGKYRVKVLPYTTNYEEQIQEVEIINFSRQSSTGSIIRGGLENSQCDFYLRPKKGSNLPTSNAIVFVQEIPKEAKSKYEAGIANIRVKKTQEGLNELKSAIELFPNYFDALELLGNEYNKLKYYEASMVILTKAVEVNPNSYRGWYGLAYAHYSLNQLPESSKAVTTAISLNPKAVDALLLYGILLKQEKDYDESLNQLKKAKEIANNSAPEVNWQLALLYANNLKLYSKAAEELELFLKEQTDSKDTEMIKKLIKTFKEKAVAKH